MRALGAVLCLPAPRLRGDWKVVSLRESADLAQGLVTKVLAVCAVVGDKTLLE